MPRPKRSLSGSDYKSKTEKQVNLPKIYAELPKTERMVNLPSIYYNKFKYAPSFLYKATGVGLSPNINGLKFYDSGLIFNNKKSFYSEDGQYAIWYYQGLPITAWMLGLRTDFGGFLFFPGWSKGGTLDTPIGIYIPNGEYVGSVTISLI